jgi:hypothetical protein
MAMGAVYFDIYRVEPCRCTQVIVLAYREVGTPRRQLSASS